MDRKSIENKIKELKEEIVRDERMQIVDPQSMYWWEDYSFNLSLLARYDKLLEDCE